MADAFQIVPYVVRADGNDVPPGEVQAGLNSLARQTQVALSSIAPAGSPVRPTPVFVGQSYFDTSLGQPIWASQITPSVIWVNASGTPV
jgi:hypothetical protein